jgi:excisionase family DNA binding protein
MTIRNTAMHNGAPNDRQAFLTTEEVLAYLKTTPRTIYRLIRSGELPAVRIGRQWRFRRTDLDQWVERWSQS